VLKRRGFEFTPADLRDQTVALLGWEKKSGRSAKNAGRPVAPKVKFAPSRLDLREQTVEE
jgi:hypothetical protein